MNVNLPTCQELASSQLKRTRIREEVFLERHIVKRIVRIRSTFTPALRFLISTSDQPTFKLLVHARLKRLRCLGGCKFEEDVQLAPEVSKCGKLLLC